MFPWSITISQWLLSSLHPIHYCLSDFSNHKSIPHSTIPQKYYKLLVTSHWLKNILKYFLHVLPFPSRQTGTILPDRSPHILYPFYQFINGFSQALYLERTFSHMSSSVHAEILSPGWEIHRYHEIRIYIILKLIFLQHWFYSSFIPRPQNLCFL